MSPVMKSPLQPVRRTNRKKKQSVNAILRAAYRKFTKDTHLRRALDIFAPPQRLSVSAGSVGK